MPTKSLRLRIVSVCSLLLLFGCSESDAPVAPGVDSGIDSGMSDSGGVDSGSAADIDAGRFDAGVPSSCTAPNDCDNTLRCDGVETCTASLCELGTAPDCSDTSACTADSCSELATMCVHTLIDADADGYAPTSLGACGTDCDDAVATTNPGVAEVCGDSMDNNCNGEVDEGAATYFADCDGDGYAALGTTGVASCTPPTLSLSGCAAGGAWTTRAPSAATDSDCHDANPAVNPGQTTYQTTAIAGAPVASNYDYDCNSVETRQFTVAGACMRVGLECVYTAGWQLAAGIGVPECGVGATFVDGGTVLCGAQTSMRTQSCL